MQPQLNLSVNDSSCSKGFRASIFPQSSKQGKGPFRSSSSLSTTQVSNIGSTVEILPDRQPQSSCASSKSLPRGNYGALLMAVVSGVLIFCASYDLNGGWRSDPCVPKWLDSSLEASRCIDKNSVCHAPLDSSVRMCTPLKSLGEGDSCWSSYDLCQDGLECQIDVRFWDMELAEHGSQLFDIHPYFSSSTASDCWKWQILDFARLMQQKELNQGIPMNDNIWIDAKCVSKSLDHSSELDWKTYQRLQSACSIFSVPFSTQSNIVEAYNRYNAITCAPWDSFDPMIGECSTKAGFPCQSDDDCRSDGLPNVLKCDSLTKQCDTAFVEQPCLDQFEYLQDDWKQLKTMRREGSLEPLVTTGLTAATENARDFVCCLTSFAQNMKTVVEHEKKFGLTSSGEISVPDFCNSRP